MALTEGLAALSSIKSLSDFAREIKDSNDPEKLRAVASAVLDLAITARAQTALLQEERNAAVIKLAAFETEVEKAKRFDDQAEGYARERTHTGATVYREKGSTGAKAPSPYYCPHCFSEKRLSVMNPAKGTATGRYECDYACPVCKTTMPLYVLRPEQTHAAQAAKETARKRPEANPSLR
jgi:hypothetical protein